MDEKTALERLRLRMQDATPHTRYGYILQVRKFLDFAGGQFWDTKEAEWVVRRYLEELRNRGYRPGTIDLIITRAVKRLWEVAHPTLPWPLRRGEPRVRRGDVSQEVFAPNDIRKLIATARRDGDDKEKVYLFLATIYALRRDEIAKMGPVDVDLEGGRLYIRTSKEGEERWAPLPEEGVQYLEGFPFPQIALGTLSWAFEKLRERANVGGKGFGWHAVRHGVFTAMVNIGIGLSDVCFWGRWRMSGSSVFISPMIDTYAHSIVGESDQRVLAQHPFLQDWR